MKRIIFLFFSIAATGILFCRVSFKQIAVVLAAGVLCSCIIFLLEKKVTHPEYFFVHKKYIILDILLISWLMIRFYSKWSTNSSVMTVLSDKNLPVPLVLGIIVFSSRNYCLARGRYIFLSGGRSGRTDPEKISVHQQHIQSFCAPGHRFYTEHDAELQRTAGI